MKILKSRYNWKIVCLKSNKVQICTAEGKHKEYRR